MAYFLILDLHMLFKMSHIELRFFLNQAGNGLWDDWGVWLENHLGLGRLNAGEIIRSARDYHINLPPEILEALKTNSNKKITCTLDFCLQATDFLSEATNERIAQLLWLSLMGFTFQDIDNYVAATHNLNESRTVVMRHLRKIASFIQMGRTGSDTLLRVLHPVMEVYLVEALVVWRKYIVPEELGLSLSSIRQFAYCQTPNGQKRMESLKNYLANPSGRPYTSPIDRRMNTYEKGKTDPSESTEHSANIHKQSGPETNNPKLLSIAQAAKEAGVTRQRIYQYYNQGVFTRITAPGTHKKMVLAHEVQRIKSQDKLVMSNGEKITRRKKKKDNEKRTI